MTKGFLKILTSGYGSWQTAATAAYINNTGDTTCEQYTYAIMNADPTYTWVRVEHDFIEGDIKTKQEAIAEGMVE